MAFFSRNRDDDPAARDRQTEQPPPSRFSLSSRISPPQLKRPSTGATGRIDVSPPAAPGYASSSAVLNSYMAGIYGMGNSAPAPQQASPPRSSETPSAQQSLDDWTVAKIEKRLAASRQDIKDGHAQLAAYIIESAKTTDRRVHQGNDLFANVNARPNAESNSDAMKIKFKQHLKAKKDQQTGYYEVVRIKTNKERVPRYRFHHVEIKKNVLTPNTMLTFVPHLRDLETSEEKKYNLWLKELEDFDLKSGFKPMNREEKNVRTAQSERARTVSLYLEKWLDELAIPGCNKSTLIQYMARQEPDDAITPQQKTDIINSQVTDDVIPEADAAAEMFTSAFWRVFTKDQPPLKKIQLRDVLLLDESVDNIMDSKPTAKDGSSPQSENEYDVAETNLASYCILGCLICFSHSCEHGEYDMQNCKHTFSLSSSRYHLRDILERRQLLSASIANGNGVSNPPCRRKCHRSIISYDLDEDLPPFSKNEIIVLRSLFATADHSKVKKDPICLAAEFLNKDCCVVYDEFEKLGISLPKAVPKEKPRVRTLTWYDRYKKVLMGDWQDHTISHEFQKRDLGEPCFHEGPCAPKVCSCVDAGILCEKFCGCSVESCAYKFTGCGCHSQGKTCQRKHNDKSSCICIQLNRECDPALCGTCGAFERADPVNAEDELLHSTGCQNCTLQRGASKALLLGQSQLEGVGYGLFTAQDIAQDDFVVEYVGELIFHDEGVRREARRGDVFDEESTISYLFTLLENEGIWVDAAIYGNLSRYINHAPESEKRGCNITPRILYVNGDFRIKFTALRDIKAGEELFFNYGDEFPNLTKKLLDEKVGEKSEAVKRKGRPPTHAVRDDRVARKAPKTDAKKPHKTRKPRREVVIDLENDVATGDAPDATQTNPRKRKRVSHLPESEEDEYRPNRIHGASESGVDSEAPPTPSRLRTKATHQLKTGQLHTPSRPSDLPKPKGKRGGARPGSGRPRKHPRPVPKPGSASGPVPTPTPTPTPTLTPTPTAAAEIVDPAVAAVIAVTASPSRSSPRQQPPSRLRSAHTADEIADSDDGEHMEEEYDDDDDQDVMVRRVSRTRRPPAKFRDEELWG